MIVPPMPPDREFTLTLGGIPIRSLHYNTKMPLSRVTDAEIIGQLCYIIVKSAGTPLIGEALSFPVSVSKLGMIGWQPIISTRLDFLHVR